MQAPDMAERRINNKLPVAIDGLPFILATACFVFIFLYARFSFLAVCSGLLLIFMLFFFRDPERRFEPSEKTILIPADGKILRIENLEGNDNPLGAPGLKVSIFMSIFDVHVNRVPVSGVVSSIAYHPGKFLLANRDKASEQNERNRISVETNEGHRVVFVQIAGFVARRIACWIKEGDRLLAGQRFGLIRFGSRVDIYLPEGTHVVAQEGQRVKAGKSILGYLS